MPIVFWVILAGLVLTGITVGTGLVLPRKPSGVSRAEYAATTPMWRTLVAALGPALIVFGLTLLLRNHFGKGFQ